MDIFGLQPILSGQMRALLGANLRKVKQARRG